MVTAVQTHKRILLIDDNPLTRESISMMLAAAGYCVALASNGADALQRLREHRRPDLILLDLSMPVLDGHDFCLKQRQDKTPGVDSRPHLLRRGRGRGRGRRARGGRLPAQARRCGPTVGRRSPLLRAEAGRGVAGRRPVTCPGPPSPSLRPGP